MGVCSGTLATMRAHGSGSTSTTLPGSPDESEYHGAALAALAAGIAPDGYIRDRAIQSNIKELRGYLRREYGSQPLVNRIVLLWASAKYPGLLRQGTVTLVSSIFAEQQPDGAGV